MPQALSNGPCTGSSCSGGAVGWGAARGPHPELPVHCVSRTMPPRTHRSGPSAPHSAVPARPASSTSIWSSATWPRASSTTASALGMSWPGLVGWPLSLANWRSVASCTPSLCVRVLGQHGASTTVPEMILKRVCLPVSPLSQRSD